MYVEHYKKIEPDNVPHKPMHKHKHCSLAEMQLFITIREMMPTVSLETVVKMVKGQYPDVFGRLKGHVADWFPVKAEEQRMKNEDEAETKKARKNEERANNEARGKHKAATPLDEQEVRVTKKLKEQEKVAIRAVTSDKGRSGWDVRSGTNPKTPC